MKLTFDRDKHEYRLDGRWVPGITAVLRGAGILGSVEHVPEQYRDRGTAIHSWAEAVLRGRATEEQAPPVVRPYLAGLRRFMADSGARLVSVEDLVAHRAYRYATMVDLVLDWQGSRWTVNLKTGGPWPFYPLQSALEALAWASWHETNPPRRACLYVSKTGTYRVEEHREPYTLVQARAIAHRALAQLNSEEKKHETVRHPRPAGPADPDRTGRSAPRRRVDRHPARHRRTAGAR